MFIMKYNFVKMTIDRFINNEIRVQDGNRTRRFRLMAPRVCDRCRALLICGKGHECGLGFQIVETSYGIMPITICVPIRNCSIKGKKWMYLLRDELKCRYGVKS